MSFREVGLVGLGKMGQAFAERLLDAGHDLTVFNRTAGREEELVERGARWGGELGELDVCFSSLADDEALDAWAGRFTELRHGRGARRDEHRLGRRLAPARQALAEAGVRYLRSPASGNPGAVRARHARRSSSPATARTSTRSSRCSRRSRPPCATWARATPRGS